MTRPEAKILAFMVNEGLPLAMQDRLKAIHIMPKLHSGHLTIRVFMTAQTAEDPEPFVFAAEEI